MQAAIDAGVDAGKVQNDYREIKVRQRSETRLYMSALHEAPDGKMVLTVKGSPPEVLTMCKWQIIANELVPLTEESVQEIETENEKMAGAALRVLGFAFRDVAEDLGEDVPCDLVWAGIVGMSDPHPRRRQRADQGPAPRGNRHGHDHGRPAFHGPGRRQPAGYRQGGPLGDFGLFATDRVEPGAFRSHRQKGACLFQGQPGAQA